MLYSIISQGGSLLESSCLYISHPSNGLIFMVCFFIIPLLGRPRLLTYVSFFYAGIMTKEVPQAVDVLTAFRNKDADKGKWSLETVAAGNPSTARTVGP